MLPRHRRRQYLAGTEDRPRPTALLRPLMVVAAVAAVWYGSSALLHFFDRSVDRKTATNLEVRSTDGVQVSLQGQDWQPGETGLRLYAGDAVSTRGGADAVLRFFDGTRIRLDGNSDVQLVRADRQTDGTSTLTFKVRSGRIWVATPLASAYTGAIVRTVQTGNYGAEIPAAANVLAGATLLNVVRASGLGLKVTVSTKNAPTLYIGEGQYFSLEGGAKSAIEQGTDPYEFRDPVTAQLLRDDFLTSSYALFLTNAKLPSGSTASSAGGTDGDPLTVTSPQNHDSVTQKSVTVSGRVNPHVTSLLVNGQSVSIHKDLSFSADVSLTKDPSTLITVEAQDAQGITLGKVERTVVNAYKIVVEPARIKSPVGSGQTLTTSEGVIEITGEAPPNTAGILVNEYKLQLFKPGGQTWSYLANAAYGNLNVGENRFTVVAVDADGNRSVPRTITIVYQPSGSGTGHSVTSVTSSSEPPLKQNPPIHPGSLTVELPSPGTSAETSDNELSIIGKTSAETYSISVNGYTLSLYQPGSVNWKYIASTNLQTMKRGKNVYRIVSRNTNGEILDILEYTLTYRP